MAIKKELTDAQMEEVTVLTAKTLSEQPKRKIKLHLPYEEVMRLQALERAGKQALWPYQLVSVNGHNYHITLGKECEVPETVYSVLVDAHLV